MSQEIKRSRFKAGDKVRFNPENLRCAVLQSLPTEFIVVGVDETDFDEPFVFCTPSGRGCYDFRLELVTNA